MCVSAAGNWSRGGRLGWECYCVGIVKLVSSVYSITVFSQIVIWLCVCISGWKLGKRGEVRVVVLLCGLARAQTILPKRRFSLFFKKWKVKNFNFCFCRLGWISGLWRKVPTIQWLTTFATRAPFVSCFTGRGSNSDFRASTFRCVGRTTTPSRRKSSFTIESRSSICRPAPSNSCRKIYRRKGKFHFKIPQNQSFHRLTYFST